MEPPGAPQRGTIPLPAVEAQSRPASPPLRGIIDGIIRRFEIARQRPSPSAALGVHPVLAYELLYDATTNPGSFITPDGQPIAAAILEEPGMPTYPERTAALTFVGAGAGIPKESFVRCPAGRAVVAVRDVLDAIEALQVSGFARQTGVVRIRVQSPSVGDFRVSFSV